MSQIQILNNLYGKTVTNLMAYGSDEFDFTPNLMGVDFSVGQFGYVVFELGDACFYVSVDGISSIIPPQKNIVAQNIPNRIKDTFLGALLQSISFDGKQYYIQFKGLDLLRGYYDPNEGYTDRDYFVLEFPWI